MDLWISCEPFVQKSENYTQLISEKPVIFIAFDWPRFHHLGCMRRHRAPVRCRLGSPFGALRLGSGRRSGGGMRASVFRFQAGCRRCSRFRPRSTAVTGESPACGEASHPRGVFPLGKARHVRSGKPPGRLRPVPKRGDAGMARVIGLTADRGVRPRMLIREGGASGA